MKIGPNLVLIIFEAGPKHFAHSELNTRLMFSGLVIVKAGFGGEVFQTNITGI